MSDEMQQEQDFGPSIPRFEFVNGRGEKGWATFADPDDLTGFQMRRLRKAAGSSVNEGEAANQFFATALADLVEAWEVPGKPDLRIPKNDDKALDRCPARFVAALEKHIKPHLNFMTQGGEDNGEPGGPTRPGSA